MPIIYSLATTVETRQIEQEYEFRNKKKKWITKTRLVSIQETINTWTLPKVDRNTGKLQPSHDSSMPDTEVLRLAKQGIELLTMQTLTTVTKTNDSDLLDLYKKLTGERTEFVTVTKGIHQRSTKPHITARVVGVDTIHIWLSTDGGDRFAWKAIGITASEGGSMIPPCVVQGVTRRGSVCFDVLTAERLQAAIQATT
ncbi:hypothetical protein [Methylomonas sp. AM2-LC]|uniref:hypothetical protein n=1 Tax=Methylomonas sp. AM2-LC TaxID=3153301 RepID=UPI0032638229